MSMGRLVSSYTVGGGWFRGGEGWLRRTLLVPSPPPSCESNTEIPKFDGNNTCRCSDKRAYLERAKQDLVPKVAETAPAVALTTALLSRGWGGGGQFTCGVAVIPHYNSP